MGITTSITCFYKTCLIQNLSFSTITFVLFQFYTDKKSRNDAEDVCSGDNGHLVKIDTAWKREHVKSMIVSCHRKRSFLLHLNKVLFSITGGS